MLQSETEFLKPGTIFHDSYEIVRCLKAGGMGAVYEVIHTRTRRRRALKTMLPAFVTDPEMRARFRREATVAADVQSDHIVEVLDAGVDGGSGIPFLVMDFLRGENLAELSRRRGPLPPEEVVELLHQASLALDRTHVVGIVHRDLKPENLFLTRRDDGAPHVTVLDFGIAKLVAQSTHVNTTSNFGTPLYMSPEQIRGDGDIDASSDLYSLGHIAFTLLCGQPYWQKESAAAGGVYSLLVKVAEGAVDPASKRAGGVALPAAFDAWFQKATALHRAQRFESASEMVGELAHALAVKAPQRSTAAAPSISEVADAHTEKVTSGTIQGGVPQGAPAHDSTGALSTDHSGRLPRKPRESLRFGVIGLALAGVVALSIWTSLSNDEREPDSAHSAAEATETAAARAEPLEPTRPERAETEPTADSRPSPPEASGTPQPASATPSASTHLSTKRRLTGGSAPGRAATKPPPQSQETVRTGTPPSGDPTDIR